MHAADLLADEQKDGLEGAIAVDGTRSLWGYKQFTCVTFGTSGSDAATGQGVFRYIW
jgi:hypothetical protein